MAIFALGRLRHHSQIQWLDYVLVKRKVLQSTPLFLDLMDLTGLKLINPFLPTRFNAAKNERCRKLLVTTIGVSILKTLSITIPLSISLTALPPMMIPKY